MTLTLTERIAGLAAHRLGREAIASRTGTNPDYEAWDAVASAAAQCGLTEPLLGYITRARTLRAMASAYVARYIQAYGPVDHMIDVSRHNTAACPAPRIVVLS